MKQILKYHSFTIPSKLRCDIKLTIDETRQSEYNGSIEGNLITNISLYPIISLSIIRAFEMDEDGKRIRGPWNPNDSLVMTKYTLPIFISELETIQKDMKIPELYTYHGKRLELNEEIAEKIRRVFMIGNTTLELSTVVIVQDDETRVEGIKVKFNNEQSSILLTLNDLDSIIFNLNHIDVESIALMMYTNFVKRGEINSSSNNIKQNVDILPKE